MIILYDGIGSIFSHLFQHNNIAHAIRDNRDKYLQQEKMKDFPLVTIYHCCALKEKRLVHQYHPHFSLFVIHWMKTCLFACVQKWNIVHVRTQSVSTKIPCMPIAKLSWNVFVPWEFRFGWSKINKNNTCVNIAYEDKKN